MAEKRAFSRIQWNARQIPAPSNPAALRYEIGAVRSGSILESVSSATPTGRYSIFAVEPVQCMTVWGDGRNEDPETPDPFQVLKECLGPRCEFDRACPFPFVGGWIGMLGYEAGRFAEPQGGWVPRPLSAPTAQWQLYDTVLLHDARSDEWHVCGVTFPPEWTRGEREPLEDRLDELADCVAYLDADYRPATLDEPAEIGDAAWNYPRDDYLAKVRTILDYIKAGDIFQANLARRLTVSIECHPFSVYERLRDANPSTHAAYLPIEDRRRGEGGPAAVLSSSPELFLMVKNGVVTTRPIKGTRPRGATPAEDAAARKALADSRKDRAELNMIIDLERNDLGRVCEYGSVRVESDGEIEPLPTVFHRTATIVGTLRPHVDTVDVLRAAFPGGSVTGAPKVRALQIIHELEPDARSAYCGAIGYIGLDGSMQLNLAIRTVVAARGRIEMHVGSGIVADSTPEDEYSELQAKAAGMLRAFGVSTKFE